MSDSVSACLLEAIRRRSDEGHRGKGEVNSVAFSVSARRPSEQFTRFKTIICDAIPHYFKPPQRRIGAEGKGG